MPDRGKVKACGGSGSILPLFLNFGTRCRSVVRFTTRSHCPPLLPGKPSLYPLNRSFHGPQSMSGLFGEEKMFFLQWESKRDSSVFQFVCLVTISTELFRFRKRKTSSVFFVNFTALLVSNCLSFYQLL